MVFDACPVCDAYFWVKFPFNVHLKEHHWENPSAGVYKCRVCKDDVIYMSLLAVVTHARETHRPDLWSCPSCPAFYIKDDKSHRTKHRSLEHMDIPRVRPQVELPCLECGKMFLLKSELCYHQMVEHGNMSLTIRVKLTEPYFRCNYCPKIYKTEPGLLLHRKQAHPEAPHPLLLKDSNEQPDLTEGVVPTGKEFRCQRCGVVLRARHAAVDHICGKKKRKSFLCSYCGKVFNVKFLYENHISKFHVLNGNFPCESCDLRFISERALKFHARVHVKPYICSFCSKSFSLAVHCKVRTSCLRDRGNTKVLITLRVFRVVLDQKTQIDLRLVHLKLIYD